MHKKNTLQQNTDTQPKRRTWKSVAAGALMLANILANPQQTAVSAHTIDRDNKNPNQSELPTNDLTSSDTHTSTTTIQYTSEQTQTSQDTIDYTNMAHFPIKWIIKHYGPERSIEIFQQTLLIEVNKVRKENGVSALVLNPMLVRASQRFAEEMFETKRFSHTGKNGDDHFKRAKKAGYQGKVDEDIGADFYSIEDGISGRKDSPAHFAAMINPEWKELGAGSGGGTYRVLMFGR